MLYADDMLLLLGDTDSIQSMTTITEFGRFSGLTKQVKICFNATRWRFHTN